MMSDPGNPAAAEKVEGAAPAAGNSGESPPPANATPKVEADAGAASPLGAKAAEAVLVKYEFKVPEGVTLDAKQSEAFSALGNKLGLKPEAAQELLDFYGSNVKSVVEAASSAVNERNVKAYNDLIGGWKKELEADPELSGSNREAAQTILGGALDQYFSKEARDAFDTTGAGWNPHVIKGILKMAKALTEGASVVQGGPPGAKRGNRTPGELLYGSTEKGN